MNSIDCYQQIEAWSDELKSAFVDYLNYWLSGGFDHGAVEDATAATLYAEANLPREAMARYRQERWGGIVDCVEQLKQLPEVSADKLAGLANLVNRMNKDHLRLLAPQTTTGNQVEAYVNGPDCLSVLLEEIGRAERYIHFSVMLFFHDKSGQRVAQALLDARARGVEVRLVVDHMMTRVGYNNTPSFGNFAAFREKLEEAGAIVRNSFGSSFGKEEWPSKRAELAARGVPESHLYLQDFVQTQVALGLNIINHRKFMIVDGHTLIIGSLNVGDQYLGDTPVIPLDPGIGEEAVSEADSLGGELVRRDEEPGRAEDGIRQQQLGIPGSEEEWHDGCFRIRGPAALTANRLFASQWTMLEGDLFSPEDAFYQAPEALMIKGEETCTLFASFPGNPINLNQRYHLDLIGYAGDETIIINPYLIDEVFWEQLQSLGDQQAKHISICNPLKINDHPTNLAAVRSHMYGPFEQGVSFYDYSETKRFSHWKIDYDRRSDAVFHGSYNLNERSACHDFELAVLVRGKAFANRARRLIDYNLRVSRKVKDAGEFFKHPALHPSTYFNKWTNHFT